MPGVLMYMKPTLKRYGDVTDITKESNGNHYGKSGANSDGASGSFGKNPSVPK